MRDKKIGLGRWFERYTLSLSTKCSKNGGLYPAPLFHMESMWNPCGIHVVPHGICPFHMEYVLAEISPILVIFFHLYSTWNGVDSLWIPCGFHHSIWNFHMESMWNLPHEFHPISMWIPCGKMDSRWNPQEPILE